MAGQQRIALFIDGANLYATTKTLGFDIDYKRLLKEFQSRGTLVRAFYYTALVEDQEYSSIRPLIDWLTPPPASLAEARTSRGMLDAAVRSRTEGNHGNPLEDASRGAAASASRPAPPRGRTEESARGLWKAAGDMIAG